MQEQDLRDFSMIDLFRMEVETQTAILNHSLLALEAKVNIADHLAALMRAAHSLKGAARIIQVDGAVQVAAVMEDCFVAAQQGAIVLDSSHIDTLLQGVDQLGQISQISALDLEQGLIPPNTPAVVQAIANIANSATSSTSPSAPLSTNPAVPPTLEIDFIPEISPGFSGVDTPDSLGIIPSPLAHVNSPLGQQPTPPEIVLSPQETTSQKTSPYPNATLDRTIRVSADNLNRLMGLAGETLVEANWLQPFADSLLVLKTHQTELAILLDKLQPSLRQEELDSQKLEQLKAAKDKAGECQQILLDRLGAVELFARRSANLADRLYQEVIASHRAPLADGVQGFPRMLRDLARQLGKQVHFEILGQTTEVDRDILQRLEAPLTHILRNAIDHGIETPAERIALGKPPEGTITIEASHRAGMLAITIRDDGRGVDLDQLRQKVIARQLATPGMVAQLEEAELLEFLFLPGFSTAQAVTEISGRGVGLDVAQSMVRQVGGTLRAVSYPGRGMNFDLQLPLTLSVMRTLLVEIAAEPYAFPLNRIDRVVQLTREEISLVENRQYFTTNGTHIGLISAAQLLELPLATVPEKSENPELLSVVVVSDSPGERQRQNLSCYGLVVDRFLGERELVVRPLDSRLGKVRDLSAVALMDDGSPVLIVDVEDLVRSIDTLVATGQLTKVSHQRNQTLTKTSQRILVVDDSITVREMERKILENKGYKVEVAVNGIDGWNAVRTGTYDLIVTDIDMPRMNGIELVHQIKSNPNLKALPIIIVSYKDREEDRLRGMEAGANYYLTKSSFHDDTLLHAVIDLIGEA